MEKAPGLVRSRPPLGPATADFVRADDASLYLKRHRFQDRWASFVGYHPHAGQIPLHASTSRSRTVPKGRRGGGTTAGAFEVQVESQLWGGAEGYADIALFAPTVPKTELLYGMVHDSLIKQSRFGRSQVRRALFAPGNRRIETAWGARIVAFSLAEESPGEGWGFRLAVIDEAQLLDWDTWWSSIRPTLSDKGGRALFIGKAYGRAFRKLSEMPKRHPSTWSNHRFATRLNPLIPDAEIDEARAEMPRWLYLQEYEAEFQDRGDAVFVEEFVDACTDPRIPVPAKPIRGHWYVDGWDLAKKQDLSVGITLDTSVVPWRVVAVWSGNREPWPVTQQRISRRRDIYKSEIWIDATGIGDPIIDNLEVPSSCVNPYIFTGPSKERLITNLQACIENRRVAIPAHRKLRQELLDYQWADKDLETDFVMALGLACWGAMNKIQPRARS
jgi:hypothetical protein